MVAELTDKVCKKVAHVQCVDQCGRAGREIGGRLVADGWLALVAWLSCSSLLGPISPRLRRAPSSLWLAILGRNRGATVRITILHLALVVECYARFSGTIRGFFGDNLG